MLSENIVMYLVDYFKLHFAPAAHPYVLAQATNISATSHYHTWMLPVCAHFHPPLACPYLGVTQWRVYFCLCHCAHSKYLVHQGTHRGDLICLYDLSITDYI